MPELPEVEVVRRGLASWVAGRTITDVDVLDPRSTRRHLPGPAALRSELVGARIEDAVRRGKFLWLPLIHGLNETNQQPSRALMAHLGMSGQLLVENADQPDEKHLKVRFTLSPADGMPDQLRFVDQRIFGGVFLSPLVPCPDGQPGGESIHPWPLVPEAAAHIARDPLDPGFSFEEFYRRLRLRKTGIKRAILDQGLISGIGNIYADEALWAAKLHFARPTDTLRRGEAERLVNASIDVMAQALEAGGTSFDSLYVNVNGASGYFERSLNAYGRAGKPCPRCAANGTDTLMRRDQFMSRSSYTCPVCQPRPRNARW